jgi:hypothetical protein
MSNAAVNELLFLLDQAFEADIEHSFMANLGTVTDEDWRRRITPESRTIQEIAVHAATAKPVYGDHAFGARALRFAATMDAHIGDSRDLLLEWAREGHRVFRERVAALADAQLSEPRQTHWGEPCRDAADHRGCDPARPVPRGRDQSPAGAAPGERPLAGRVVVAARDGCDQQPPLRHHHR